MEAGEYRAYWIGYSGPGERPRYAHQGYSGRDKAPAATAADATAAEATATDSPPPAPAPEAAKDTDSESKPAEGKVARGDG
ncbi:MAG: hypothetical protein KC492_23550 [Myxococcales bacterium]|nr:hypothetical protein [Myxococcales bacterium]